MALPVISASDPTARMLDTSDEGRAGPTNDCNDRLTEEYIVTLDICPDLDSILIELELYAFPCPSSSLLSRSGRLGFGLLRFGRRVRVVFLIGCVIGLWLLVGFAL